MDIYHPVKTCLKCSTTKPVSEFYKCNSRKDGLQTQCKICAKEYHRRHYIDNEEKYKLKINDYYSKNKNQVKSKRKDHYSKNKSVIRQRQLKYQKLKRISDPLYKLKRNTVNLISNSIRRKGFKKNSRTEAILGCDYNTFICYIESQFDKKMNWNNYGTYWDIDHIIPVSSAITEQDIMRLNHYTNLQPLESYFNRHIKRGNIL